ncbi:acyltransferase [Clostridium sp. 001]|uniref:acyltransferase family protein n=1 Tax=Clostridium sp. 001 TaxID=1970093 RepID=UPI001C2C5F2F|nr:acyltransferase [Clostridium sp. 001]QXE17927.1 hypothetical protein B5S50_03170 [Clostridium sp. 001]
MEKTIRRCDMDWIRTVAVLLIIPFHASIIFDTNPKAIMYIRSGVNIFGLNIFEMFLDRFQMTLLFFLAGMAAYYSLKRRDNKQFLQTRGKKLFLPVIIGSLTLCPITTYIYSKSQGSSESFIHHYIGFFTKPVGSLDGLNGGYTPMHLWFILYLFLFSLIGLPIFRFIMNERYEKMVDKFANIFSKPMLLLTWVIPYSLIFLVDILDERNPIAYFFVMIIGFICASNEKLQRALERDKWVYLILSFSLMLLLYFWVFQGGEKGTIFVLYLKYFIIKSARIVPSFAIVGLGSCYIKRGGKVLRYLSKASFPIYIIHMIVVTTLGYFIIRMKVLPIVQYFAIVILSYMICFLIYEGYRRFRK